ncbi:MAG: transglutaminase-like domain-containing protein [Bacillota bacterium]
MQKKNFRRTFACMLIFMLVMANTSLVLASSAAAITNKGVSLLGIDSSKVAGKVQLQGESNKDKLKVLIIKDSEKIWRDLEVNNGHFDEEIWLTQGKGTYTIAVMVHEADRKYSYGPKLTVENVNEVNPYLVPTKHIESDSEEVRELAAKITENKTTDIEKVRAIYEWVSTNISYDYEKFSKHQNGDYDNTYGAVHTLKTKKGVCYDYAALAAALGRAVGLESKVVKGQASYGTYSGYHAWNEIYIGEEDRWVHFDTTFGAADLKSGTGELEKHFDNEDFDENHIKQEEI